MPSLELPLAWANAQSKRFMARLMVCSPPAISCTFVLVRLQVTCSGSMSVPCCSGTQCVRWNRYMSLCLQSV